MSIVDDPILRNAVARLSAYVAEWDSQPFPAIGYSANAERQWMRWSLKVIEKLIWHIERLEDPRRIGRHE